MTTKKLGYIVVILGVLIASVFLLLDFIGAGDGKIGARQLFGLEIGLFALLLGLSFVLHIPDKRIQPGSIFRSGLDMVVSLPVSVWVVIGFFIVFILFFLSPVFLNPEWRIAYLTKYLPDMSPIGLDLDITMRVVIPWVTDGQSPYPHLFYPPLMFVLFAPMVLIDYPFSYFLITFLTLFSFGSLMLLALSLAPQIKDYSLFMLFFITGILSYGFQFELERGQSNVIAFFLCMLSLYIFYRHYGFRLIAYLLFSLSIHMKLYPAIFIFMFIKDWRDWTGNLKRIAGLGLLNFALLFVLGIKGFTGFIETLVMNIRSNEWSGNFNHSITAFVTNLFKDGFGFVSPGTLAILRQKTGLIQTLLLLIVLACILLVLVRAYRIRTNGINPYLLLVCTLGSLIIPISNDYTLPNLAAPMALFLSSLTPGNYGKNKFVSIFLVLFISISYASILYPPKYKPDFLVNAFPPLFLILVFVTILYYFNGHSTHKHQDTA